MNKNLRMLVADDHRMFIQGIQLVLNREANIQHIDFASNGKEAIDKCNAHSLSSGEGGGEVDVILMDINMPVIDGIEATREIKRHHPEIKIIMVSMLGDYASVVKSLKAGADGYVLKNTDSAELITAINKVLRGEIYLSESLSHLLEQAHDGKLKTRDDYIRFSEHLITPREQGILKLIAEGKTDSEISGVLNISDKTVSTHRKNMLAKLGLRNTAQLVRFAIENKLV